jgi:Tol biopolymer transport system component
VILNGRPYRARDLNVWGVTFAGADRFYATVGSRGQTWLVRGDLAARTLTGLDRGVECPSLSPDGTRVAYKRRPDPDRAAWRLHVLDLRTGRDVALAETRNVDDQAEWLDDGTVLYGLPRSGSATDVWAVPADGRGAPRVFIPDAWSPAVVR